MARRRIGANRERRKGRIRDKPAAGSVVNNDNLKPIFSLEYMVNEYGVGRCDAEQKAAFADALWQRSQLTWRQIIQAPRHGLGSEKIYRSSIAVGIPPAISEDVVFLSMRFYSNAPMVGFRVGQIFHIVWLDTGFSVYDHGGR